MSLRSCCRTASGGCTRRVKTGFYYVTMYNEDYVQGAMPEGAAEGIVRGMYKVRAAAGEKATVQLLGSGRDPERGAAGAGNAGRKV